MEVYIATAQDWMDFVNGKHVVAHKNEIPNFYKKILVSQIEVVLNNTNVVTIMKMY
jgi:hypothetical protein